LLNEFLKEHGKVEKLEAAVAQQRKDFQSTIAQQQKSFQSRLAEQEKQIEALASSLQKVSTQIELGTPAPRVTVNDESMAKLE
jgi:septal ring factor EnvC (AmiA/AmiB activator)